jgi:hypothetical protein
LAQQFLVIFLLIDEDMLIFFNNSQKRRRQSMTNQEREGQEQWIEGWLELYDLTLHKKMEARLPEGLYIRGVVGPDQSFVPQSAILGGPLDNPPETGLRLGWLDLTTVKFHDVREAIGPHRPYVLGFGRASTC